MIQLLYLPYEILPNQLLIRQILKLGEMQISEKERGKQNEALFHEIASVVVEKCVDSVRQLALCVSHASPRHIPGRIRAKTTMAMLQNTKLPLTVAMIERAIKGLTHRFDMNKSAKQQVRHAPQYFASAH